MRVLVYADRDYARHPFLKLGVKYVPCLSQGAHYP